MSRSGDRRVRIERLAAPFPERVMAGLVTLLQDAVHDGASIGFHAPVADGTARAFWRTGEAEVAAGRMVQIVARDVDGAVAGTVQIVPSLKENGWNRAELCKLLVRTSHRRQGIASALLDAAEAEARALGRGLLFLDTTTDSPAQALYRRRGWTFAGTIPDYASMPDGVLAPTSIYWKRIGEPRA